MVRGRILAVDDDRFFREFYADVLGKQGYTVDVVADAQACLRKLAENPYDLVILDLILEETNGIELARRIRAENPGLEMMMATKVDDMVSMNQALALGIKEYVIKPIHEPELIQTVADILERQRIFLEHGKLLAESAEYFYTLSLYRRGLAILSTLEAGALVDTMLEAMMEETQAAGAMVWLSRGADEDGFYLAGQRGLVGAGEPAEFTHSEYRFHDLLLREVPFFPPREGGAPGELDRAAVHVPLIRNKELLGIVKVVRKVDGPFKNRDLRTLRMLGEFSAVALQNARVVEDLRRRASRGGGVLLNQDRFYDIVERERATAVRYNRAFSLVDARIPLPEPEVRVFLEGYLRETDGATLTEDGWLRFFLPETDGVGARSFGRRFLGALRARGVPLEDTDLPVPVSFPADGETLSELRQALEHRRAVAATSAARLIRGFDFWSAVEKLLQARPTTRLDKNGFLDIAHFVLADMAGDPRRRCALFLGLDALVKYRGWLEDRFHMLHRLARLSLFGDASDFRLQEGRDNISSIHVPGFPGVERCFVLYLTPQAGLTVLYERAADRRAAYIANDEFLTDALILALQEQYFLQRQL